MLEIGEVKEGPFPSQEAALAQKGGILPLNTKLVQIAAARRRASSGTWSAETPVISGRDMRNARAGQDEYAQVGDQLHAFARTAASGSARFTEAQHRQ